MVSPWITWLLSSRYCSIHLTLSLACISSSHLALYLFISTTYASLMPYHSTALFHYACRATCASPLAHLQTVFYALSIYEHATLRTCVAISRMRVFHLETVMFPYTSQVRGCIAALREVRVLSSTVTVAIEFAHYCSCRATKNEQRTTKNGIRIF